MSLSLGLLSSLYRRRSGTVVLPHFIRGESLKNEILGKVRRQVIDRTGMIVRQGNAVHDAGRLLQHSNFHEAAFLSNVFHCAARSIASFGDSTSFSIRIFPFRWTDKTNVVPRLLITQDAPSGFFHSTAMSGLGSML